MTSVCESESKPSLAAVVPRHRLVAGLLLGLAASCGSIPLSDGACEGGACDAGRGAPDGGPRADAGLDAGGDAGRSDGGALDAGVADGGARDASISDAGAPDGSVGGDAGLDAGLSTGTCSSPIWLSFVGDMATANSTTAGAAAQLSEQACLTAGPERVFAFSLSTPRSVTVEVSSGTSGFRPTLAVRGPACATDTRDCVMSPPSGPTRLEMAQLQAGTWFVMVDGAAGASGDFILTVTLGPPGAVGLGESCADPYRGALSGDSLGSQITVESMVGLGHDAISSSCDGTGPDRVYRLNITEPRRLTVSLSASPSSPNYRPVIYVQRGVCSSSGSFACHAAPAAGGTATLTLTGLEAGTYYIWLDTYGSTTGSYRMDYSLAR